MKQILNILFITPNYLTRQGGGTIGQLKIYNSLRYLLNNADISSFSVISPDNSKIEYGIDLNIDKTKALDLKARIFGHSNFLYLYRQKIINYIKESQTNVIILGNSRLGFLAKQIKKINKNIKVITHFDNVEYDYVSCVYKNNVKKRYEQICVHKDEKAACKYSDTLAALTNRDIETIKKYYKTQSKIVKYPVCITQTDTLQQTLLPNILFIGSLNYGPNIDAIKSLIKVIKKQTHFQKIIIAGSNPTAELISIMNNEPMIESHINFKKISDFAKQGDILVSMLREGAGMKVKVAEAMSLGLLVVGYPETFVGYEDVMDNSGLFEVASEQELLKLLNDLSSQSLSELLTWSNNNQRIYLENYSDNNSNKILKGMIYGNNR